MSLSKQLRDVRTSSADVAKFHARLTRSPACPSSPCFRIAGTKCRVARSRTTRSSMARRPGGAAMCAARRLDQRSVNILCPSRLSNCHVVKYSWAITAPSEPSINTAQGAEDWKVKLTTFRLPEKACYAPLDARRGDGGDTTSRFDLADALSLR
jgi:hypothetical protein